MIGRDVIYDINALRQDGLSVDRYFAESIDDTTPSFSNQFTDGVDPSQVQAGAILADVKSANYVQGTTGWIIKADGDVEFNDGDFRGNVEVGSIDIGGSDATSAHIDTDGNFWLGAASFASAPARISKEGAAVFSNVQIGGATIQYVITNSGIFSFGDGSDGDVTISVGTDLTRDMYYNNLTINSGVTLNPAGYRIFVKDTLTLNGTIARNGNAGSNGTNGGGNGSGAAAGGLGGAALADGYLKGSVAGGDGATGSYSGQEALNAASGTAVANSIATGNGSGGGDGGDSGDLTPTETDEGSSGGGGGTTTASNVKLIANWHLATLLDVSSTGSTVKFTSGGGSGGGGGGGGDAGSLTPGGGGGGAGSGGGIVAVYAKNIIISATGSITANGGNGGNGGAGGPGSGEGAGGGGGGGGGHGGVLILCYNSLTNAGSLSAAGGAAGTGGVAGAAGTGGAAGAAGAAGTIYQFELSL